MMTTMLNTQAAIEDLVAAVCGENATARDKHIYRENLRGLVRLAQSEQMLEMKTNAYRLTGSITARAARRLAKEVLLAQRLPVTAAPGQKHLEFNRG